MKFLIIGIGGLTSILLFGIYFSLVNSGFDAKLVHTFLFMCFGTYTLFLALPLRNLERGIWTYSIFSNRYMIGAIGAGIVLMLIAVYLPPMQYLFDTVALPPLWLAGAFLFGLINIAVAELGKWITRVLKLS